MRCGSIPIRSSFCPIRCGCTVQCLDLDLADDLALLVKFTKQTGLNIHISEIQVMCINATPDEPIMVNGDTLDYVEEFTYPKVLSVKTMQHKRTSEQGLGIYLSPQQ